ncbi:hypothetical protein SAMN05216474_2983 [Lishizhenia tianjinensis]|uniref:Outer membrane protein beta-barrel domain-containing protein n=1 Tax=Lishizhenia tianjinensis TaxID=477690 RepID=A0A1I7BQ23_9FLAO|nr:hypothetical protein [Lishizhenia tianjinensis]SFT89243.1 hypothetical protein SAMN05216474_2983 [Lishizhenia tianjinensis]
MKKILAVFALMSLGLYTTAQTELTSNNLDYITSVNLGVNTDFNTASNFAMSINNGVLLRQRYMLSLGVGLEGNQTGMQLPMTFEGKYLILKNRKKTPFVSFTTGYLQPLQRGYWQRAEGGFTAGVQVGFQNFFSEHVGIATSVGFRHWQQRTHDNYYYYYDDILPFSPHGSYLYVSNRFEVKFAFIFK